MRLCSTAPMPSPLPANSKSHRRTVIMPPMALHYWYIDLWPELRFRNTTFPKPQHFGSEHQESSSRTTASAKTHCQRCQLSRIIIIISIVKMQRQTQDTAAESSLTDHVLRDALSFIRAPVDLSWILKNLHSKKPLSQVEEINLDLANLIVPRSFGVEQGHRKCAYPIDMGHWHSRLAGGFLLVLCLAAASEGAGSCDKHYYQMPA